MRKAVLIICILCALGIATAIYAQSERAATIRRVVQSSVTVIADSPTERDIGSGTVIGSAFGYSFVLTCHHVIDLKGAQLYVVPFHGIPFEAFVELDAPQTDLALLVIRASLPVLPIAPLPPELYDTVYVVGAPDGETGSASEGMITSLDYPLSKKQRVYRITNALVMEGISGGTATNTAGELIGVPAQRSIHTTQQGALIPLADVIGFVGSYAFVR